jgi:uncharacterized membrane protein
MNTDIKIGLFVFFVALIVYVYSSFYLGSIKAIGTFVGMLTALFSGFLFNKNKAYLKVIAVILNVYLLFLFFMPKNIKQGLSNLKNKEANEIS